MIRDRFGLSEHAVMLPKQLGLLLALCDGTRDSEALRKTFELYTGLCLEPATVDEFLQRLDEVYLLDTPRAAAAVALALESYRSGPFRPPACAGRSYPAGLDELRTMVDGYLTGGELKGLTRNGQIRGIISPHIDFQRGGPVYAATWRLAEHALREVEVAVIFGTDHAGPDFPPSTDVGLTGQLTLTRQNYCTPYGVAPTCQDAVDAAAAAIGPEAAFAGELHHRTEHSIELALVWLQHFLRGRPCEIVPILCGSFQSFTDGRCDAEQHRPFGDLIDALRTVLAGRRGIVVAAADLAHVGPAFGDNHKFGQTEKAMLKVEDVSLLESASTGDAEAFLRPLVDERDRRRICGLPPIYLALRLMAAMKGELAQGELIDYAQCPADENNTSVVSVGGMLFS
ncbi:MAG: AmmeMemoRadiSam system protein B [Chloroflexi bacterium]|nr:AmmeMemoRadiSam system protein B [Chloroflexota bacterium]